MSRAKGKRTIRKAKEFYRDKGWQIEDVEKSGKYTAETDLFGLFDLVGIKEGVVLFVQCKTNRPATQAPFKEFAKQHCGDAIMVHVYTWYDYKGAVIQSYTNDEKIHKEDYR